MEGLVVKGLLISQYTVEGLVVKGLLISPYTVEGLVVKGLLISPYTVECLVVKGLLISPYTVEGLVVKGLLISPYTVEGLVARTGTKAHWACLLCPSLSAEQNKKNYICMLYGDTVPTLRYICIYHILYTGNNLVFNKIRNTDSLKKKSNITFYKQVTSGKKLTFVNKYLNSHLRYTNTCI